MRLFAFLLPLLLLIAPARADERIVAGMSQNRVSITATFDGSEILIFGAVKRESPPPDSDLQVAIVIEGPSGPVTVRKKDQRLGIWVNTEAVEIETAPSFYAVATSAPLNEVITPSQDLRHHITIPRAIRLRHGGAGIVGAEAFTTALIRIRSNSGLYKIEEGAVDLRQDTLFSTRISLPSNLTEGDYRARIYLTRAGKVISAYQTEIDVKKVGLERWLYRLAHDHALLYGLMSLAIAIAAGWAASSFFRYFLKS
ncbi:MAG: hypothetical protein CR993_06775 [Rhodobacterales bacterium]|nr:MAG: hypothetical protein CR993_06775 [Rhodobacterales bacterium]